MSEVGWDADGAVGEGDRLAGGATGPPDTSSGVNITTPIATETAAATANGTAFHHGPRCGRAR